jgi:hypothetical protein
MRRYVESIISVWTECWDVAKHRKLWMFHEDLTGLEEHVQGESMSNGLKTTTEERRRYREDAILHGFYLNLLDDVDTLIKYWDEAIEECERLRGELSEVSSGGKTNDQKTIAWQCKAVVLEERSSSQ